MEDLGRIKLFEYQIRLFQDGNQFFENTFKNNVLIIGREDDCDLIIQDRSISRKHLRIEIDIDKFYVTDIGSSNGTFIDNVKIEAKTEINSESHIRAGKITIQVVVPEINKKVTLEKIKSGETRVGEEPHEITLSKIALHLEDVIERTRVTNKDDIMALVNADFVTEMTRHHESSEKFISRKIESLVLWNKQIFSIDEFGYRDTIVVGPTYDDSIHIPSIPFSWELSRYDFKEAVFTVPKNLNVFAIRGANFLSKEQLVAENRISENQNTIYIQISHYDVLRVEIDENTQLYFRYVPSTVELESKRLLNPDVLIKKALMTSFIIHLVLSLIFVMIPKEKIRPKAKKPPERIAKLIVEEKPPEPPPPPIVIPPPPPPPEPPPPPPEPPKPEPQPEPPKPKVEPPKPKPEPPKPKPKPKPEPVKKLPPKPVKVQPRSPTPAVRPSPSGPAPTVAVVQPKPSPPAPPTPPPPKPVDITKLGALAAISGMKLDAKSTKSVPQNVTIVQNTTNTNTGAEVGMNSITSDLKNQTAGAAASNATNTGGPIKTKGSGSVGSGYGKEGVGTGTGKRGVKGAILGKPQLTMGSGRTEGLSREQINKALQPYLGKIQSCYERSLLSDPNLTGRIEFEWNISAGGSVKSVSIKKNSVAGGEQLGECVAGVIKSIKFPAATNGQETTPDVGFPFGRL